MSPLVSIIIPLYNRAGVIGETIKTVQQQTYTSWECIVIDDGSTDGSVEAVSAFAKTDTRITVVRRPEHLPKGANACRNHGIHIAKGRFLIFLDADDFLLETCLKLRVEAFSTRPEHDFLVFLEEKLHPSGHKKIPDIFMKLSGDREKDLIAFLSYTIPWRTTGPIWNKETFNKHHWDEALFRLQDVDIHIQLLLDPKTKYEVIPYVTSVFRAAEKSKIDDKNHVRDVIDSLQTFLDKYLAKVSENLVYKKSFKKFILFFMWNYIVPNKKEHKEEIDHIKHTLKDSAFFSCKERLVITVKTYMYTRKIKHQKIMGEHLFNKYYKEVFDL